MEAVQVNPYHVKLSKELDDNHPTKNDRKDPKVIAGLVLKGQYLHPYIPEGIYAELRCLSNQRFQKDGERTSILNQLRRWYSIYFPEFKEVYTGVVPVSALAIFRVAPLPQDIVGLGVEEICEIWRKEKMRAVGSTRAKKLVAAATDSVGCTQSPIAARLEFQNLLEDYERVEKSLTEIISLLEELILQIPFTEELLAIHGVGLKTVSGFLAEVGDIRRFNDPKQIQKLAGLALKENSSGKHKGRTTISKRGRKRLRHLLFEAALSLVGHHEEFKAIHHYYTTRAKNPLKKMQSLVAIGCKLIRIFYAILHSGQPFDSKKMRADIRLPQGQAITA